MIKILFFLCFSSLILAGCSSLACRVSDENLVAPGIYPGVRTNVEYLLPGESRGAHPEFDFAGNSFALMALLDMPLTFAADTIFLPHDLCEKRPLPDKKEKEIIPEEATDPEFDPLDPPAFGD
ncbi:MAG: YceK/YidQ family lipoprotein [Candidatus Omnitrophica bacterium]|nr:YceK/YidQ family lipoprotein [Candidatus Omnitrophota bacterium]